MYQKELEVMIEAAKKASIEILKIYHTNFDVEIKSDDSPVTLADKTADLLISKVLKEHFPDYALLTEESLDDLKRRENDYVFIVDPIDGTKDFIARNGEFTVNIGLAYKNKIVAGVIMIPCTNEIYYASYQNGAYYLLNDKVERIHVNDKLNDLTMLTSNFHTTDKERAIAEKNKNLISVVTSKGSSIKACHIAHGKAEVSFRLSSGTKEWDTAASQIIVQEAGGVFAKPSLEEIYYNREDVYNREGYVILNKAENNFAK